MKNLVKRVEQRGKNNSVADGVPGSSTVARLIAFHLEKPYIGFPEFCGPLN